MNTACKSLFLAALSLSLCACSGTSASMRTTMVTPAGHHANDIDMEYVAAVERAGRVRGVKTYWVHAPKLQDRNPVD